MLAVEKPGRYVGGEWGSHVPDVDAPLRIAICFPDLYEIGMANHALKLLYTLFERIEGVSCERVFAVAPDFETELRSRAVPLYSLESGTALSAFDIVAFSIGYELAATTALSVLDLGGISIRADDRGSNDPIVIAGGPAVTNPIPFGAFIDATFIGEIEGCVPRLIEELVALKKRGADRSAMLDRIASHRSFWTRNTERVIYAGRFKEFGKAAVNAALPIPGLRTVQDHGAVEIMRGCPNGCRFCHASFFYRPFREKPVSTIFDEVAYLVESCGYREVTLSSLSTGDYSNVFDLVRALNAAYRARRVSFALPSIRIDSFTLSLLEQVSAVRKSGLTFAVETPRPDWQRSLNKEVSLEKTIDIMLTAKEHGWKLAKFYFMLGLPVSGGEDETPAIAEFLETVVARTGMGVNVNVATFVPKPHTPFQWAPQLDELEANRRIQWLKRNMKGKPVSVRYNAPFASLVEGVICRGDSRVARTIENAYQRGARLDAWEDYFDRDAWRFALSESFETTASQEEILAAKPVEETLPWDGISLGIRKSSLIREYKRAISGELSATCAEPCSAHCGVCSTDIRIRRAAAPSTEATGTSDSVDEKHDFESVAESELVTIVADICYEKRGRAVYLSHLDTLRVFERALYRSGASIRFSEGFNPKPRIEFAHPLSLGYSSDDEVMRVLLTQKVDETSFIERMNASIHDGYCVKRVSMYEKSNTRLISLMSRYWGSEYRFETGWMPQQRAEVFRWPRRIWELLADEASQRGIVERIELLEIDEYGFDFRLESSGKVTNLRMILTSIAAVEPCVKSGRIVRTRSLAKANNALGFEPYF